MHAGSQMGFFGNFTNEGTFTNNLGTLHVVGVNPQVFNGTNVIHTNNLVIDKGTNPLQLDNVLQVSGNLSFTNGLLLSDDADIATEYVEFLDGSTYSGASNASHIDGVVRKTGNDAFVFPVGTATLLRTVAISAPASLTDHFTAFYDGTSPDPWYSIASLDVGVDHVSDCEYWILNRTGGSSDVEVTLSWASNSCGIDNLCDLIVSRWNGTLWTSEGNGGVTGTFGSGSIVSGTGCSTPADVVNFSPFTLGSISGNNPLPITLLSFDAKICGENVCLAWQTATERNNDFFTIEKSTNGINWEFVTNIDAAGNSQTILNYETMDQHPFSGLSYYRLMQTDYDGRSTYSAMDKVQFAYNGEAHFTIYPNPSSDKVTIEGLPSELNQLKVYNSIGQDVTSILETTSPNPSVFLMDVSTLTPGVYVVKTTNNYGLIIKQ